MKGSIVLRGFKSWVDKFHHPLPLDRRESTRLLTALKTSFRSHLDENHPQSESARNGTNGHGHKTTSPTHVATHSASLAADRHMSSILTSPLLAKSSNHENDFESVGVPDLLDIKAQLVTTEVDPLEILNRFRNHSGTSVAIVSSCLRAFDASMTGMTNLEKQNNIVRRAPGQSVISWLETTNLYGTRSMLQENVLMTLIVPYLLTENREEKLWDLLHLRVGTLVHPVVNDADQMFAHYKWKAITLSRMVRFKCNRNSDLNGALATLVRAIEHAKSGKNPWFSVTNAARFLCAKLTDPRLARRPRAEVDEAKYDLFCRELGTWSNQADAERLVALLSLHHPTRPDAEPTVRYLRKLLKGIPHTEYLPRLLNFIQHDSQSRPTDVSALFANLERLLIRKSHHEDVHWIRTVGRAVNLSMKSSVYAEDVVRQEQDENGQTSSSQEMPKRFLLPTPSYG